MPLPPSGNSLPSLSVSTADSSKPDREMGCQDKPRVLSLAIPCPKGCISGETGCFQQSKFSTVLSQHPIRRTHSGKSPSPCTFRWTSCWYQRAFQWRKGLQLSLATKTSTHLSQGSYLSRTDRLKSPNGIASGRSSLATVDRLSQMSQGSGWPVLSFHWSKSLHPLFFPPLLFLLPSLPPSFLLSLLPSSLPSLPPSFSQSMLFIRKGSNARFINNWFIDFINKS